MKKLSLIMAAVGIFFATATQAQVYPETIQETPYNEDAHQLDSQDDFESIELAQLPAAVNSAVTRDYAGATTQEAWMKEKDGKTIYKLKLDVDGDEEHVYVDAQGNWIEKDKDKDGKDKEWK